MCPIKELIIMYIVGIGVMFLGCQVYYWSFLTDKSFLCKIGLHKWEERKKLFFNSHNQMFCQRENCNRHKDVL